MADENMYDVIIVGGSYAGLSAAMSLARALRKVLIIDSGKPCNRQTPHSHNFITQDGNSPQEISARAREQVLQYSTVHLINGLAIKGEKIGSGFRIETQAGDTYTSRKLIIASGIKDIMPGIEGFAECWGISVIHCPYCHGYEVKNEKTGIFGNGDYGFEFSKLILNWTKDLTLYTNGNSTLSGEQTQKIRKHNISIMEAGIDRLDHRNGQLQQIIFRDGSSAAVRALYARLPFEQHSDIPEKLGCEFTEQGYIKVDGVQRTSVPGVYACGDNANPMRALAAAVSTGTMAGAMLNREMVEEDFS